MRRIFFKGLKFKSLLYVYAHRFPTFLDSFSLLLHKFDFMKLFTCFFTCLMKPSPVFHSHWSMSSVSTVDPSLAAVKMRQIDLSQAAFGMIYRFLGGFPHAFTGPKSPQWSPEEGF